MEDGCVGFGVRRLTPGDGRARDTYAANGDILLASLLEDLGNDTLLLELKVHLGLVGLNLDENLTGADGVAGLLLPGTKVASRHGRGQGGHLDDLVVGEGGIAADDVGGEAIAQGAVGGSENAPPDSGAKHLCENGSPGEEMW